MLRIIEGGLFSEAYGCIKSEILEKTLLGKRIFLIVPEQQAVIAEKEFAELLPESAPLTFEVTNFTRLANSVYRTVGGIAAEYLSPGKEALIMWKTLKELAPYLKLTEGAKEINSGIVAKALGAYSEAKSSALTADDIAALAENPKVKSEKKLCDKLLDLSKIMVLFTKLTEEKYANAKDDCEKLGKLLSENGNLLCEADFYVTGFTSFTKPQIKVLSEIMKRTFLSVHLTLSRHTYEFFEFSEIKNTKAELLLEADRNSCTKSVINKSAPAQEANHALMEITDLLWRTFGKIDNESLQNLKDSIRIFEATDPYEAAMFIASDIKRRVMQGAKYRDFAIIARDGKKYSGIIDAYLEEAEIPCFVSKKTDISQYEAIKLIYTAFSAVRSRFSRTDVISYAKCRLSGVDMGACDEFELYTEKWNLDKERFSDGKYWDMSPEGYDGRQSKANDEALERINQTKKMIIEPLLKFSSALENARTVRDYASRLIDFLTDISLEEKICEKCNELSLLGEEAAAREARMLWRIICSALDDMTDVLGDTEIGRQDFENQLRVILSEADIGKIPTYRDVVTIGSADMARFSEKEHVYLFGVNASEFPGSGKTASYFTDRDKQTLSSLGALNEDIAVSSARELFFFSRAMAVAKKSVSLLCFTRNEAFAASEPAAVIKRISDITSNEIAPEKISERLSADNLYSKSAALSHLHDPSVRRALIDSGHERDVGIAEKDIENLDAELSESSISMMYGDSISLSQTRIDAYVDCPFEYFLKYNIKLSENEPAEFDARNIGTFIHAILENFFSELKECGKFAGDITESEKAQMVKRAAEKYISEKESRSSAAKKRTSIITDRIYKAALPIVDGLCDELSDCKFLPEFFELKIGDGKDDLPRAASFTFDNAVAVDIKGIIDRVDVYKSGDDAYVRVIDYKSGQKSFSPSDIDNGKNLQMFLYLKAIVETESKEFKEKLGVGENGRIIPAGVIYVKTDMSDAKIAKDDTQAEHKAIMEKQARQGMILDDAESIEAMNKNYLPVKFKTNGEPYAASKAHLYSLEDWKEINEKISDKIHEVSSRMRSGEISASRQSDPKICDRCKFKNICRKKK